MSVIPDLIEIGVDVINPVQVIAMDPEEIKRRYGDTLSLFGGVSTQQTFPYGTPEDVKNEVKQRIEVLGEGGGYILAAGCIPDNPKLENLQAMHAASMEYGLY